VNHSSADDTVIRRASLRQQGFRAGRLQNVGDTGDHVYGEAKLRWGGVLQGREANVDWRASKDGVVTEVGATVQAIGALARLCEL
jgi:hypothetical protein